MNFSIRKPLLIILCCFFSSLFYILPAQAHEPRLVIDEATGETISITVGWRSEPVFQKMINSFDFIVNDEAEVGDIELDVYVLFLAEDTPDARVISSALLTDELRRDRTNPNRFNKFILPTKVGAYGFHIMGMVDGTAIDEIFICRGGTQNADGRSFGCVEKPQKFPGGSKKQQDDDDD